MIRKIVLTPFTPASGEPLFHRIRIAPAELPGIAFALPGIPISVCVPRFGLTLRPMGRNPVCYNYRATLISYRSCLKPVDTFRLALYCNKPGGSCLTHYWHRGFHRHFRPGGNFSMVMNRLIILFALCSFALSCAVGNEENPEPSIIAGRGWGKIVIGASKNKVSAALGKGKIFAKYDDVYFVDYPEKGIQISFESDKNTVYAIFFYNKQRGSKRFASFKGKTSTGIDWNSSVKDVIKAYGKPLREYEGNKDNIKWRRLVFKGIDFRFENEKMVRISVPARESRRIPGQY